jgi:phospholipid/cholesterol/gamma-HCH transport system substrate-binding protein
MPPPSSHEGGLSVREQIERYRTPFIAVVTMFVIAVAIGGYILAHENLKLPGWVPVVGHNYYTLEAEFQTAQAITPGQGQAVTIAGAKVGEVASVDLKNGVAIVSMKVTPKYAHFYKNATLLLRPKTQLQDMTVEVNPGTPSAGKLKSGELLPQSHTAPNVNFDEFLAGLDAETRAYLQELLAGAGVALKENSKQLSATFKRFDPTAKLTEEIAQQVEVRHANTARAIHNFRLLMEALGGKDKQLAELVDAANAVFATFAKEDANLQKTLHLLPTALHKTENGLGKLGTATRVLAPTLEQLQPFARSLAPTQEATRRLAAKTTPVIKNEIRPFARQILPVVNELQPSTRGAAKAFPKLATSFSVLNEFFNELAYNPGPSKPGFLFFLDWGNHDLNSVLSSSDATGPLGRTLVYFNCEVVKLFKGAEAVNETVKLLLGLLKPPQRAECKTLTGSESGLAKIASANAAFGSPLAGALAASETSHSARTKAAGGAKGAGG